MRTIIAFILAAWMAVWPCYANPWLTVVGKHVAVASSNDVVVVGYDESSTTGTTGSVTVNGVQAGDAIFVCVRSGTNETFTATCADSLNAGNMTLGQGPTDHSSSTQRAYWWYRENSAAGNVTVTVTFSESVAHYITAVVVRNVPTSGILDGTPPTPTTPATNTSHTSPSITPTVKGATLSMMLASATGTQTAASGETVVTAESGRAHAMFKTHAASPGAITHSCTYSTSSPVTWFIVAIKAL